MHYKKISFSDIIGKRWPNVTKKNVTGKLAEALEAKPVQGALKLDIYLDNSAKNTFLQR